MSPGPPSPASDAEHSALALEALLDHLNRGDARHALLTLRAGIERRFGTRCSLVALAADGSQRWTDGPTGSPADGWAAHALQRLGRTLGWLRVQAGPPPADTVWRPLVATLAALLLRDEDGAGAPGEAGPVAMVRAALAGAGTVVWEWNIESDALGDIDEGLQQLGYAPGEIGRTQDDWNTLIHADDRAANHEAYLRHARNEVDLYEHAYRARARDGSWRWFLERGRIVERHADGTPRRMLGTQTDITEQRAAAQAASDATQRLEKIARHAPGLLYQFEQAPDGRVRFRYASERMQALFGLTHEQAMKDASAMFGVIHPDDRRAVLASVALSAQTLGDWRQEFRVVRPDGSVRWLLGNSTPQREADGTVVWHGTVQDVTESRELEAARQLAALAEAANRAKTEFLSRVSHELRTPLNAVLGFTQLMEIDRAEPPTAQQQSRLLLIRQAGEHLLQMIGDLLDLTRIESGVMVLALEPTPLRPLAEECLAMVQGAADRAGVTLGLEAPATELHARVDRTRLRQVLLNLLGNGIKYNRPAGRVDLHLDAADGGVRLQVHDTGIGIDAADLPRLFEPFFRGARRPAEAEGAGIGLSVTQALVSLMGGRIAVESRPGGGSTFTVTLPAG